MTESQTRETVLVCTFHWDREWHRTFEGFRARLVDAIDRVLALAEADAGYHFMFDGQTILLEDYLELRPGRRADLRRLLGSGRFGAGPWYVQPDCLLPSGEAHVRNLNEGRRVAASLGTGSAIAYTPDSFGHPAQLPQLLAEFGIGAFVYWRGNDQAVQALPSEWWWEAPDGSRVLACHLREEYAWTPSRERTAGEVADELTEYVGRLAAHDSRAERLLVIRGGDHVFPEEHTREVADAFATATGGLMVRGLLEDFVTGVDTDELPVRRGELLGALSAPLLPGTWSTRTYLKLANRSCEAALEGWAEPWAAFARALGAPDERPALRAAWRALLSNQAHDSICGCSQDAVHRQMGPRYESARELADETTTRALERIAGLGDTRRTPWSAELDVAVFNPSPHPRTDVVRVPMVSHPIWGPPERHPLMLASMHAPGFTVDGAPARPVAADARRRVRRTPDDVPRDVEFVAADVPAFGYRTFRLAPGPACDDVVDAGRRIANETMTVEADPRDGTLTLSVGDTTWRGLGALEDLGDRGDVFDFDGVAGPVAAGPPTIERVQHPAGLASLRITRRLEIPALTPDRLGREGPGGEVVVSLVARLARGVERLDLDVQVDNRAPDHRLRLLFPTGGRCERFTAASTFDATLRTTVPPDDTGWEQPAPRTFPCQGWVTVDRLTIMAPGLYETEVTEEGTVAVTLLRAVGDNSRTDLRTRPEGAGPSLDTPDAQCLRSIEARIALAVDADAAAARDAELGLRAVFAGEAPLVPAGAELLRLEPAALVLSAVKPAEEDDGIVVRVLNPTCGDLDARLTTTLGVADAAAVRLDERPVDRPVLLDDGAMSFPVPAKALRSVRLTPARRAHGAGAGVSAPRP